MSSISNITPSSAAVPFTQMKASAPCFIPAAYRPLPTEEKAVGSPLARRTLKVIGAAPAAAAAPAVPADKKPSPVSVSSLKDEGSDSEVEELFADLSVAIQQSNIEAMEEARDSDSEVEEPFADLSVEEARDLEAIKTAISKIVAYQGSLPSYSQFEGFGINEVSIKNDLNRGDELLASAEASIKERKDFFEFLYDHNKRNPVGNFYDFIKKAVIKVLAAEGRLKT